MAKAAGPITSASSADHKKLDERILFLRGRNNRRYAVGTTWMDKPMYVSIGGVDQWMTIRGYDRRKSGTALLARWPG